MGLKSFGEKLRWRSGRQSREMTDFLEKSYARELGTAFAGKTALRSQLLYAAQLYNEDRYEQGLKLLGELLKKCGTSEDRRAVLLFTALCRSDSGDREGAVETYRLLLQYAPEYSTALSNLGQLLMAQGKYDQAEGYLVSAVEKDPANVAARHNLGTLYYRMGEFEKAIPFCEGAMAQERSLYQACTTLALCHMALGNLEESKRCENLAIIRGQNAAALRNALREASARQYDGPELSEDLRRLQQLWHDRTAQNSNLVYVTRDLQGRSRIGGPSLGEAPLDESGNPMRLLCAIFCEEFFKSPLLPHEGLLRIYIAQNESYGLNLENPTAQTGFRVLYDREYDHLIPGEDPGPSENFPVGGCYGIRPGNVGRQPMPLCDYRFDKEFADLLAQQGRKMPEEDQLEALGEWMSPEGHRIGGYPCFTQEDPRWKEEYQKYDTLLFQLDSMNFPEMHIDIGDSGVMHFCIPGENLKRLDFSDVLYWWDCY